MEESEQRREPDQFLELFAKRYQFDPWRDKYYKDQFLARLRDGAGPSFGWVHDTFWQSPAWTFKQSDVSCCDRHGVTNHDVLPLDLRSNFFTYLQDPGGAIAGGSDLEWAFGGFLRISKRLAISERVYHKPTVTLFGRWLSLDRNRYRAGHLDQDVFTPYKANHRFGLRAQDSLYWQPCKDVRWYLSPSLATNENFNIFSPDYVTLKMGQQRLIGNLRIDAAYRIGQYFADNDRANDSTQHFALCRRGFGKMETPGPQVGSCSPSSTGPRAG